jgi:hypothetical protein
MFSPDRFWRSEPTYVGSYRAWFMGLTAVQKEMEASHGPRSSQREFAHFLAEDQSRLTSAATYLR